MSVELISYIDWKSNWLGWTELDNNKLCGTRILAIVHISCTTLSLYRGTELCHKQSRQSEEVSTQTENWTGLSRLQDSRN
jgi:hypothetical protein